MLSGQGTSSRSARLSLPLDVVGNTAAAARDARFPPLLPREVDAIHLEVSVLHPSRPLSYDNYKDLLEKLRLGVHGVIIGWHERGAFLWPQAWERLPEPSLFLQALCEKAQMPDQTLRTIPRRLLY